MRHSFICCLLVRLIIYAQCNSDPDLQIRKKIDDTFVPVTSKVEEFRGAKFTLLCELVSSKNSYIDNQIAWVKKVNSSEANAGSTGEVSNNSLVPVHTDDDVNKAEKIFDPLESTDEGTYICTSLKYSKYKTVEVIVLNDKPYQEPWLHVEAKYCSDHMFKCVVNGLCIQKRFVCDGKADCKDGSDESPKLCNGDACRDKLRCEDGRCIPTSWCCDKNVDPDCNVTITPTCCQILFDSYGDMEYHYVSPNKRSSEHGARYLFISICSLSIVFSMVLFILILMKIIMFARKNTAEATTCPGETINLQGASSFVRNDRAVFVPRNVYGFHGYRIVPTSQAPPRAAGDAAITEPFFPGSFAERYYDEPPSYNDIAKNNIPTINIEPPPPYTSREHLDVP